MTSRDYVLFVFIKENKLYPPTLEFYIVGGNFDNNRRRSLALFLCIKNKMKFGLDSVECRKCADFIILLALCTFGSNYYLLRTSIIGITYTILPPCLTEHTHKKKLVPF